MVVGHHFRDTPVDVLEVSCICELRGLRTLRSDVCAMQPRLDAVAG